MFGNKRKKDDKKDDSFWCNYEIKETDVLSRGVRKVTIIFPSLAPDFELSIIFTQGESKHGNKRSV